MGYLFVDITGKRFGRLTALSFVGQDNTKSRNRLWRCQCDCGKFITTTYRHLNSRHTTGCSGCRGVRNLTASGRAGGWNKLGEGEACFNSLFIRMKNNAISRKHYFNLTKIEVRSLTQRNCYYCGLPPSQVSRGRGTNGVYIFNGIDRIDSSLGYIIGNVRPCCKHCNMAKAQMTEQGFYEWVQRVANHITTISQSQEEV